MKNPVREEDDHGRSVFSFTVMLETKQGKMFLVSAPVKINLDGVVVDYGSYTVCFKPTGQYTV
jgi:hypothetical protein